MQDFPGWVVLLSQEEDGAHVVVETLSDFRRELRGESAVWIQWSGAGELPIGDLDLIAGVDLHAPLGRFPNPLGTLDACLRVLRPNGSIRTQISGVSVGPALRRIQSAAVLDTYIAGYAFEWPYVAQAILEASPSPAVSGPLDSPLAGSETGEWCIGSEDLADLLQRARSTGLALFGAVSDPCPICSQDPKGDGGVAVVTLHIGGGHHD